MPLSLMHLHANWLLMQKSAKRCIGKDLGNIEFEEEVPGFML